MKLLIVIGLLLSPLLNSGARAAVVDGAPVGFTGSQDLESEFIADTEPMPAFDPALGKLNRVSVRLSADETFAWEVLGEPKNGKLQIPFLIGVSLLNCGDIRCEDGDFEDFGDFGTLAIWRVRSEDQVFGFFASVHVSGRFTMDPSLFSDPMNPPVLGFRLSADPCEFSPIGLRCPRTIGGVETLGGDAGAGIDGVLKTSFHYTSIDAVSEPSTLGMLVIGVLGTSLAVRRTKRRSRSIE